MGRASRLKQERRAAEAGISAPLSVLRPAQRRTPIRAYRYFREFEHAEAFIRGDIRLSTLEVCRGYENPAQGDAEEAIHTYNTGSLYGSSEDAEFVALAARAGIAIGPGCSGITVTDCKKIDRLPDAYVLCLTDSDRPEVFRDDFGPYCVEITNLPAFAHSFSIGVAKLLGVNQGRYGPVTYREREYTGFQPFPGELGFVKPLTYAKQREIRLLWERPDGARLEPIVVSVPGIRHFVRRVR